MSWRGGKKSHQDEGVGLSRRLKSGANVFSIKVRKEVEQDEGKRRGKVHAERREKVYLRKEKL